MQKNKYTLIYNKHKLPLGRAVHNCKQYCSTYWNWTYNIHSTVNHSCTFRRSSLSGHIVSSTSQRISSLAMQRGKYLLEWRIHPLQDSAVMSSHAASMPLAGPFGYVDAGHIPSTSRKRKNPLLDLGMVSREGDIPPASYHVLQTTVWQHLSGENAHYHKQQHAYSDGLQLDPSHSQGLCPCKECLKKSADVVCCMDQDGVYGWGRRFLRWLHT